MSAGILTSRQMAGMIDHTLLRPGAVREDFVRLCREAAEYGFKSVAVNPFPVALCRSLLEGTGVLTGAAISFPLGQTGIGTKVREAETAIRDGAGEFDYVLNIGRAREHDFSYIEEEMSAMTALAGQYGVTCKVILETCYLTEEEIREISGIASSVRPDFIKTSTGFGPAGAKPEHVRLMKRFAGEQVAVKAAGGIRSLAAAMAMVEAGASRIGTSSGPTIMEEMRAAGL